MNGIERGGDCDRKSALEIKSCSHCGCTAHVCILEYTRRNVCFCISEHESAFDPNADMAAN